MEVEEGRIIKENPLRILGVFSDSPKKEIVANLGKLRAFAKTGKALSFDSDYTSLLGPVNRTSNTIEKANNDISLPKDKLQAGLFWFMQHTDNDKAALDCLKSGDVNGAMVIIQKKGNYSSVVNMAVLALILKRWDIALYSYAYLLESATRRGALVKAFTDTEDYFSEEDLVDYISCKLILDFPSAHWIEQLQHENVELGNKTYPFKSRFENSKLLTKIASECIITIKKAIDEVLGKAASVSRDDARANLSMAATVEEKCKILLKDLRLNLGKESKTYIEYADNIANQILDNCIDYYTHDANNPKRAQNVIRYCRYAYRIAESKTTKERTKKNLDILNETLENKIPDTIEEEYNAIDKLVKNYKEKSSIGDCSYLLGSIIDDAYRHILSIKNKLGKENKHYISISSNFVSFAFQEVVKKLNKESDYKTDAEHKAYITNLHWGRALFDSLVKFDKDNECQTEFDKNFAILMDLIRDHIVKQNPPKPKINQTTNKNTSSSSNSQGANAYTRVYTPKSAPYSNNKESDNSGLIYFICLGVFVFLVIVFFTKITSNHSEIEKEKKQLTVRNPPVVKAENKPLLEDHTYSDNYLSSNNRTINENILNQDLSNYHFDSDKDNTKNYKDTNTKEVYSTVQHRTGDRPYQSTYGKGDYDSETQNSLLIKNGSSTDAVVFLERTSGKKVRHVFIRRGDNFSMTMIPGGRYIIKVMQGTDWNPEKNNGSGNPVGGFMKSFSISKSESYDAFDYPYPSSGQYGQYEVTLYKVQNGNMQTESINENELF